MVEETQYLKSFLSGESRAYGFTIAFWGSGALLIGEYGVPDLVGALAYGTGAITGFGLLALFVYKSSNAKMESGEDSPLVLSTIHYLASLLPVLVTALLIQAVNNLFTTFFLSGMSVSIVYNSLAVLEEYLAEFFGH